MAKLKQAMKLVEQVVTKNTILEREVRELTTFMAVLVEQLGGTTTFTLEDAKKLAGRKFDVKADEGKFTISLV